MKASRMRMFRGVMNEAYKEAAEIAGKVAGKTIKNVATIVFLVAVMPPIFVAGCVGTVVVFACETGEKIVEVGRGIKARRRKK